MNGLPVLIEVLFGDVRVLFEEEQDAVVWLLVGAVAVRLRCELFEDILVVLVVVVEGPGNVVDFSEIDIPGPQCGVDAVPQRAERDVVGGQGANAIDHNGENVKEAREKHLELSGVIVEGRKKVRIART